MLPPERTTMKQNETPQAANPEKQEKRTWQSPEIVNVGGVLELTEAIIQNVNDGSSACMRITYKT
jgi:hypothetical protein